MQALDEIRTVIDYYKMQAWKKQLYLLYFSTFYEYLLIYDVYLTRDFPNINYLAEVIK